MEASQGPPYLPKTAGVGGRPTVDVDVPVLAVLLLLYILGAVANMAIFQLNRRKGHKFLVSWAMFGFCMARIATCVMRIVWATRPSNTKIAIASSIFTAAGVLVLYAVVLVLALRIVRATQPELGWNRPLDLSLKVMYVLLGLALALVIGFTILSFYTLNTKLKTAALWIQRGSLLYMLIFNVIATTLYLLALLMRRATNSENFGSGSMRSKFIILGVAIFFCDFIAGFRMGTIWASPRPFYNPGWYQSKEAFYIIELGFEIIVLYWLTLTRIDKRFWVPNGCKKPGDFSQFSRTETVMSTASSTSAAHSSKPVMKV